MSQHFFHGKLSFQGANFFSNSSELFSCVGIFEVYRISKTDPMLMVIFFTCPFSEDLRCCNVLVNFIDNFNHQTVVFILSLHECISFLSIYGSILLDHGQRIHSGCGTDSRWHQNTGYDCAHKVFPLCSC